MITKEQATATTESGFYLHTNFHALHPNGAKCANWRRNGKTKTWVTRPDEFRIPVKYGLYAYDYIDETNGSLAPIHGIYIPEECPRH